MIKGATLKIYKGAPHGLMSTIQEQFHADLLEFAKQETKVAETATRTRRTERARTSSGPDCLNKTADLIKPRRSVQRSTLRRSTKGGIVKIIVIGGTGLIGSKVVTKLRESGFEAVVPPVM